MNNLERIRTARGMTQETLALSAGKTNVVKGGFEKNRLIQQSGGSFVVIDTAQGGERGGTLAGEAQTVYRRSFPCWYKQTPEAALSGGLGGCGHQQAMRRVYTGALLAVTDSPLFRLKHFDCPGQKLRHADTFAGSVCLNTVGNLRLEIGRASCRERV